VTAEAPYIVTGLDLPADAPGGSVELVHDLYTTANAPLRGWAFMLRPDGTGSPRHDAELALLDVPGKCLDGAKFWRYTAVLTKAIASAARASSDAVVHLQHLAFGASPALISAYPRLPQIALVHGTDLLFADTHPTQRQVLHRVIAAASAIVVPTVAMADRLTGVAPDLDLTRVVHIPWGIPDQLLDAEPTRSWTTTGETLRLLYAGRVTAEKGAARLIAACQLVPGVRLSIAAPRHEYTALSARSDLSRVTYLGWLSRRQLWKAFDDHDLLVVPSTILEAFGLVAIEAQARGLPVACQPVPGLREILSGSALEIDLSAPADVAAQMAWLRRDSAALGELRRAGLRNAARYPLSVTASRLTDLSLQISQKPRLRK
jgi:glycosyltransferase involved in cell wall biosynthesis